MDKIKWKVHLKKGFSGYDIQLHQMMKIQFWSSGECEVTLYRYYSQVHTDPEW